MILFGAVPSQPVGLIHQKDMEALLLPDQLISGPNLNIFPKTIGPKNAAGGLDPVGFHHHTDIPFMMSAKSGRQVGQYHGLSRSRRPFDQNASGVLFYLMDQCRLFLGQLRKGRILEQNAVAQTISDF